MKEVSGAQPFCSSHNVGYNVYQVVEVYRDLDQDVNIGPVQINWSALGACDLATARVFREAMVLAVKLADELENSQIKKFRLTLEDGTHLIRLAPSEDFIRATLVVRLGNEAAARIKIEEA